MAEEDQASQEDRTEEATPERREEFRERGQIAVSKEVSSVIVLASSTMFLTFHFSELRNSLELIMIKSFRATETFRINDQSFWPYMSDIGFSMLMAILPICTVSMLAASTATLLQTRFNFSWKRLQPDFSRVNPLKGIVRLVSMQAAVELIKGSGKMAAVALVTFLILRSEWLIVPGLATYDFVQSWIYWGSITTTLFWSVAGLLVLIASFDYIYNLIQVEKKLKMTKKEVKEEFKKREVDPQIKARIKRLQRDLVMRKMLDATKDATVVITNPTHYAVALKYEVGMSAPQVVAKGVDHLALKMREVAKEHEVELVENKPLARTLYKIVEVGEVIPESLYRAVSEIIRYVFHLKGMKLPSRRRTGAS